MQNMKKIISLLLVVIMMMSMTAFAAETTTVPELTDDEAVITINGNVITGADIKERYAYYINYYQDKYDVTRADIQASIRNIACKSAVQDLVMGFKIDELNITLDEDEMNNVIADSTLVWDSALKSLAPTFGYSEEATDEEKQNAMNDATAYLIAATATDLQGLIDSQVKTARLTKLYDQITAEIVVDPSEVEAVYQQTAAAQADQIEDSVFYYELYTAYGYELYNMPAGYRGIKQILLAVDDAVLQDYLTKKEALTNGEAGVTQEDVDAAAQAVIASVQDEIDDIYTSFNNGTATFDQLIDKYNIDPGMTRDPAKTYGYNVHAESIMWDEAFTKAAMSIASIGGISEPSVGQYGIYICYYLRDVPAGVQPITESVYAAIEADIRSSKAGEAFDHKIEQWLTEYDVVYSDSYHAYVGK